MITRRALLGAGIVGLASLGAARWGFSDGQAGEAAGADFEVMRSDAEWRHRLTPEQYSVLRQAGTERPFTSALLHEARRGTFTCAGCDRDLFASATKFDSGTGWPSFYAPLAGAVGEEQDRSFGFQRTAIHCSHCGGHLGHVFNDGPKPTGLRYCMNGVALAFRPATA